MKTQLTLLAALMVFTAGAVLLDGVGARADDAKAEAAPAKAGVWVYDVRVVRVDPATKEGAEAAHPFGTLGGSTTKLAWPAALAALKQRGTTTILMDQNITTMPGDKARSHADRTVPIMALNFANRNDEQKRSSNVRTGCRLDLQPLPDRLQYGLQVRWALQGRTSEDPPEQFVAEWNGSHPPLAGETLVLHYREQVAQGKGSMRAVEIYGLVTGRFHNR